MKKIICMIRPFEAEQKLYVSEDDNRLDIVSAPIDNLNDTILALVEKYNTTQVDFVGPKTYNQQIANELKDINVTKYNNRKLVVNVI